MVRKVTFVVRAAPTLGALLSFAQATRKHRSGLGDRLERDVRVALESAARTLEPTLGPLGWLARRGLARPSGYLDATGLTAETTVTFDLRAAVSAALDQGSRLDGRAYTDLYSLRALVRSLRKSGLVALESVLLGRQADTARSLLRAVETACRETALLDEELVPKAFRRMTPAAPEPSEAPKPPSSRAEPAFGPKPETTTTSDPSTEGKTSAGGSFGGLPDDATSPPETPEAPLSDRGLTLDAEFFLEHARLKVWPCSDKVLTRARRTVLIQLHPDRAGEGSEACFRSALKGFDDLSRALAAMPPTAREARPTAEPPTVTRSSGSAVGQWPPPPPMAAEPIEPPTPKIRRQSFSRSSKA